MKEKGMFFTEEQKQILREIDNLEKSSSFDKLKIIGAGMPERVFIDERKSLSVTKRMDMANKIIDKYSMLKKQKGILHEQIFSAMEEYLKACIETGYKLTGL